MGSFIYITKGHFVNNYIYYRNTFKSKLHKKKYFIIRNNFKINNEFLIYQKYFFSSLFKQYNSYIKTSSLDFNNTFTFLYNGNELQNKNEIMSYINPKVQTTLLDIKKNKGNFAVYFKKDYTVFLFDDFLVNDVKTNLIKNSFIDKTDKENLKSELKFLIENTTKIVHHLK
jgi:hypothetical protein